MPEFLKKDRAKAKIIQGTNLSERGQAGRDMLGEKIPNKTRLDMVRKGTKDKLDGVRQLNRLKKNQTTDRTN